MNTSANLLSAVTDSIGAPAYLDRTYGQPLFHTESDVAAMRFSEDGLLWTIEESGLLRQWTVQGRQVSRRFLSDLESLWHFSPTGKFVASGSHEIALWYVNSGQEAARLETGSWITALAFSSDGKLLASGHDDGSVCVWQTTGLKLLKRFTDLSSPVSALSFRSNGKELASADEDRKIQIWNLDSYKLSDTLVGHPDRIPALAWKPNTDLVYSAGWDTSVRIWQPPQTEPKMLLNTHSEQVTQIAFNHDGSLLACADSDFEIHLWDNVDAHKATRILRGHSEEIRSMIFSADSQYFASAGADRSIRVWNLQLNDVPGTSEIAGRHQIALVRSQDKDHLYSSLGTSLLAWDSETAQLAWNPKSKEAILSLAASPDGKWLASSGASPVAELWDIAKQTTTRSFTHTFGPIGSLTFSPDSRRLAAASQSDGLVWLWDPKEPEAVLVIPEAADSCTLETLSFHPNGKLLAVGGIDFLATSGQDGAVCIWDLEARDKIRTFENGVTCLHFDPQGRYLAGGALNFSTIVWDLQEDKAVFELPGHSERIGAVAFSPDGSWLVSASDDCTIRVWNVLNGRMMTARTFDTAIQSLSFGKDGQYLYTGNADSTCYRLTVSQLIED